MTNQHPLTDEICLTIDDNSMIDEDDWKGYMRAAADWQLEQVEKWLKDNVAVYAYQGSNMCVGFDEDDLLDDLRKAMRPTTTQENN